MDQTRRMLWSAASSFLRAQTSLHPCAGICNVSDCSAFAAALFRRRPIHNTGTLNRREDLTMAVSARKYGMLCNAPPPASHARRSGIGVRRLSTGRVRHFLIAVFAAAIAAPPASAEQLSIADLVNRLQPSVVNITITRNVKAQAAGGNIVTQDKVEEKKVQSSGFFINSSGVILTNRHVITDAGEILVTLHDGSRLRASVVAEATSNDIALLRVNAGKQVPTVKFGDSDLLRPGDSVFLIGNPLGLGSTVTSGIVSAVDRNTPDSESASFIQIDAALNVGNSGGPVFNKDGEVVGVSTALATPNNQGGSVGLGLAIPGNDAHIIMDRLVKSDQAQPGWIGVHVQPVTEDIAAALRLAAVSGAIITRIDDDSPAAQAQLNSGDVVLKIDDDDVWGTRKLNRKIAALANGKVSRFTVWRAGSEMLIPVTIGELRSNLPGQMAVSGPQQTSDMRRPDLGLKLTLVSDHVRAKLGISTNQAGVLVEDVVPNSAAWDHGIIPGSVILKIDHEPVTSAADVLRTLGDARSSNHRFVLLLVRDTEGLRWTPLPIS